MRKTIFCLILLHLLNCDINAQSSPEITTRQDTLKGKITPERAWWDVVHYNLTVKPDYNTKTISGKNIIEYKVLSARHAKLMQIDLQAPLIIDSVKVGKRKLSFQQEGDAWLIQVPTQIKNKIQSITVFYSGKPRESVDAPWDGGVIWTKDSLARPWMSVACQLVGASIRYPCKVHQGDEPNNGAVITIVVPDTLVAVSNGRLRGMTKHNDGTASYSWKVTSPINNYGITFYIGKYTNEKDDFNGENGMLDMDFWVLDYNRRKVKDYLLPEVDKIIKIFEHWFGPYPFYKDGFKMVESSYIGMEHQTAVAYGNHFQLGRYKGARLTYWDYKTDRMIVHENAHEWFGNNITAKDPADRWFQEGFAGFAEQLIMESLYGTQAGLEFFLARTKGRIRNRQPVISRYEIFEDAGEDMFLKGWVLVHLIRTVTDDDERFRRMLRTLNNTFYHQTVTSRQIEIFISNYLGRDFSKVFNQYLRTIQIPVFEYKLNNSGLEYRFTNCIAGFGMPVKTNWTKNRWLYPTEDWKTIKLDDSLPTDTLHVLPDFHVTLKKVE